MLTIEYRVNGQLIGYTNIRNIGFLPEPEGMCRYEYWHVNDRIDKKITGELLHNRNKGMEILALEVLKKVTKQTVEK